MTCRGYNPRSGEPCRVAVNAEPVLVGCQHEHVSERSLCGFHLADVATGNMLCGDCMEAGCPCRLALAGRSSSLA